MTTEPAGHPGRCAEPGCLRVMAARGLCNAHYKRRLRDGTLPPRPTLSERLWARVIQGEGCWLWTGAVNGERWGYISHEGAMHLVHRVAFELRVGAIPPGSMVRHTCGTRLCVRPDHLYIS